MFWPLLDYLLKFLGRVVRVTQIMAVPRIGLKHYAAGTQMISNTAAAGGALIWMFLMQMIMKDSSKLFKKEPT
jgi:hypothetical protein